MRAHRFARGIGYPGWIILGVFLGVSIAAAQTRDGDFEIPRYTVDGGGSVVAGGEFEAFGAIGQPDVGLLVSTDGSFEITGGFWVGAPGNSAATPEREVAYASRLLGAMPNPFLPRTRISFQLSPAAAAEPVRLDVFDLEGRRVCRLVDGVLDAGTHVVAWNGHSEKGEPAQSGVYFARLQTAEGASHTRLIRSQ